MEIERSDLFQRSEQHRANEQEFWPASLISGYQYPLPLGGYKTLQKLLNITDHHLLPFQFRFSGIHTPIILQPH